MTDCILENIVSRMAGCPMGQGTESGTHAVKTEHSGCPHLREASSLGISLGASGPTIELFGAVEPFIR
ncbi:hypothetical protein Plhal703r1_c41g0140931 [Plasmopara halstedii]